MQKRIFFWCKRFSGGTHDNQNFSWTKAPGVPSCNTRLCSPGCIPAFTLTSRLLHSACASSAVILSLWVATRLMKFFSLSHRTRWRMPLVLWLSGLSSAFFSAFSAASPGGGGGGGGGARQGERDRACVMAAIREQLRWEAETDRAHKYTQHCKNT